MQTAHIKNINPNVGCAFLKGLGHPFNEVVFLTSTALHARCKNNVVLLLWVLSREVQPGERSSRADGAYSEKNNDSCAFLKSLEH